MKKAILLSLVLVGSALSANVFMGPEYAKELCEVWNKTPRLTEELGKSESWTSVPERKIFLYREDCSPDRQVQLTIKNEGNKAVCVYGGPAKDKRGKERLF
jgi:putative sterol carrier protein